MCIRDRLLDGAHGTRFSRFLDELVDIDVEYTYKYMEVIGCESVKSGLVTEEFIHICLLYTSRCV